MNKRSSGVLLHVSSLPGPFESGAMGEDARRFVRQLSEMGCAYWQILPLNHLSEIRSPYSSRSLFALNPAFIDLYELCDDGLLSASEIDEGMRAAIAGADAYRLSPGPAKPGMPQATRDAGHTASVMAKKRLILLKKAFMRVSDSMASDILAFTTANEAWLLDYALFCALKTAYDDMKWCDWPNIGHRLHKPDAIARVAEERCHDVAFWQFAQFVAYRQWAKLKAYANSLGVGIIGDIPIYAAFDSVDCWSRSDLFQLNTKHMPKSVAGVPPDYFNSDGQLWGNPLYDWNAMSKDGYAWWLDRIGNALSLYDIVRIDHFRGFYNYWSVPYANKTARKGEWALGPGMGFIEKLKERYPLGRIVVEDLGDLDADVKKFFKDAGYPGMRVMQFGFGPGSSPEHKLSRMPKDCLAYTGTHDNSTVAGWCASASPEALADSYCDVGLMKRSALRKKTTKITGAPEALKAGTAFQTTLALPTPSAIEVCRAWISALYKSEAGIAICTMQDLLGQGDESRMNRPGLEDDSLNWSYRVTQEELDSIDVNRMRAQNAAAGRLPHAGGVESASAGGIGNIPGDSAFAMGDSGDGSASS